MFLMLLWAPGTDLPFCLFLQGLQLGGRASLLPTPHPYPHATWPAHLVTAPNSSCIPASHQPVASDSPLRVAAGIKLQKAGEIGDDKRGLETN